ncbi:transcriptional regulator CynR [Burkholderia ubonensis]|uniref:transcriptional regulator CynR n=1 Tax=Burkholderia ubonensis TaxID=101571 RepID=UPI0008FE7776|nr:transcriptional regulator CynR [Burkholderia ubonensis]OJA25250.1 transcriptional regulator CynR [Burkholderia ubonensis]OJB25444.1 transcriptional regulator CynR [Burkholderia ubonensis]
MLSRGINYFIAVAEHGSFTRAATALYVSQPALSQQIKQLEETLGTQLFDRAGRVTSLTDAGEVYFRYARRALQDLEEGKRAIHDVADLSGGSLRVAITPIFTTYLIGPLVESFHDLYPNITLTVREMPQAQMEPLIVGNEIDVGIAFDEIRSPEIDAEPLLVEMLALVVNQDHCLARDRIIGVDALNDESMVLMTSEFVTRVHIDQYFLQHNIRPRIRMEANSLSAIIEIVRRTRLATLLPASMASNRGELVAIELAPSELKRTAVLLQRKGAYQTAAARAFIELALECADGNFV